MRRLHSFLGSTIFLAATSATFAAGCDEAAAPLPQGAWSVTFVNGGGTCNINSHNAAVARSTTRRPPSSFRRARTAPT